MKTADIAIITMASVLFCLGAFVWLAISNAITQSRKFSATSAAGNGNKLLTVDSQPKPRNARHGRPRGR